VTIANSAPGQCVQQRALADVRLPRKHDLDSLTQQHALARAVADPSQFGDDPREAALRIGALEEVDFLLGKVERRLDQHAQLDQRIAQLPDLNRECAAQRAAGRTRGRFGAGVDQVGNRFGLSQIELVVQERTFR
jgi:hypothetical protein